MSRFEFVSHEEFRDDDYIKELVYLCIEGRFRVAYVRKKSQTGGLFWSVVSLGVVKDGKKEYHPAFLQDSNFLEKDIKDYLEKRKWEKTDSKTEQQTRFSSLPHSPMISNESQKNEEMEGLPF